MKNQRHFLVVLLSIPTMLSFAQDINALSNYEDITQKTIKVVPDQMRWAGQEYDEDNAIKSVASIERLDEYQLYCLFNDDAVGFYDLDSKYPTPLQVKAFVTTDEYKQMLSEMKAYKEQGKTQVFSVSMKDFLRSNLPEYDLAKHGFTFCYPLADVLNLSAEAKPFARKEFAMFSISALKPYAVKAGTINETECFTIPVPEDKALLIEKLEYQCDMLLLFDFERLAPLPNQYQNGGSIMSLKYEMIIPKSIRAVFVDTEQGEIIYSTTIKTTQ